MSADGRFGAAALGLTSRGGNPGRHTPTEDRSAEEPTPRPRSEGGGARPGVSEGGREARGSEAPPVRAGVPAREASGARAHDGSDRNVASTPGAGITRRNTPPARRAGGRSATGTACAPTGAPHVPRVLCTRIDAFKVAYRGDVRTDVRRLLVERLAEARSLRTGVAIELAGRSFELHHRSRDGWWRLSNPDASIVISDDPTIDRWSVVIEARAVFLATRGPDAALEEGRRLASEALHVVQGERLRRADLCADVADMPLDQIHERAWVLPRRTKLTKHATLADHSRSDKRTGFTIGKGHFVVRIYDTREELSVTRDEEKRGIEEARWSESNWRAHQPVTRVEVQLQGDALKEIDAGALENPETFLARCDSTWAYATRRAVRLVDRDSATRVHRCRVDHRWTVVQGATFNGPATEIPRRTRRREATRPRIAFAYLLSAAAGARAISPLPYLERSAREHLATRSNANCEAFVHERVKLMMRAMEPVIADALIDSFGPRMAAEHLIERQNATCARVRRLDEERRELVTELYGKVVRAAGRSGVHAESNITSPARTSGGHAGGCVPSAEDLGGRLAAAL